MKRWIVPLTASLTLICWQALAAPSDEARQAATRYQTLADRGDIQAQFALANLYADGNGVAKDIPRAMNCWRFAAEAGSSGAAHNLSLAYARGVTGAKDPALSYYWIGIVNKLVLEAGDSPTADLIQSIAAARASLTADQIDVMDQRVAGWKRLPPYTSARLQGDIRASDPAGNQGLWVTKLTAAGAHDGSVDLDCPLSPEGRLHDCRVTKETPANSGVGDAVGAMVTSSTQFIPRSEGCVPVGGLMHFSFRLHGG